MIRGIVRFVDQRTGSAPFLRKSLRYLFPDHWSFLLGEVALYLFLLLVATGVYLTFFFDPSTARTIYHGSYEPLRGASMSHAYASVVGLSFDKVCALLQFFQELPLRKAQVDALLHRLARHWQQEFDVLCTPKNSSRAFSDRKAQALFRLHRVSSA